MVISAIATMPPYATYIDEVLRHPIVSGIRLNTVMPTTESIDDVLRRLHEKAEGSGKNLWIDLKCRQLRVQGYWVPPYTEVLLSHRITVPTPVTAYFSDGNEPARVLAVDGNRLIMQDGPRRVVGPGEAVNIPHPALSIEGYFTDTDRRYMDAGITVGVGNYMLSFVEGASDVNAFKEICPDAKAVAKIESQKGLQYVRDAWNGKHG